jgi:endoglycosylceramidase
LIRRIPLLMRVPLLLALAARSIATPAHAGGEVMPRAQPKSLPPAMPAPSAPLLRALGRHFVDQAGRVVILRGVSLSGGSKVPPFRAVVTSADLDGLPRLGMNVIRLLFLWEAYEPIPGCYDEQYLADLQAVARAAWDREMYVIVDFHQDGFSRYASRGSGDGFPGWAVSPRGRLSRPDNSIRDFYWPLLMMTDPTTYKSFNDFFNNVNGVRARYIQMTARVTRAFAALPGVIGYDLLNEPWGNEQRELAPLYCETAAVIQAEHPSALLFIEGQLTTNTGIQSKLPRLPVANIVYAPHYYKPLPIVLGRWYGVRRHIERAFVHMTSLSEDWHVPLFVGEFGMPSDVDNAGDYMTVLYDLLDACLASGAQWNYTPTWTAQGRDGWNGENFNFLDRSGTPRCNFRPRPYPRLTAGSPLRFTYQEPRPPGRGPSLEFLWVHRPERGDTELFVPAFLFPPGSTLAIDSADATCRYDAARQVLVCHCPRPATIFLRLTGPVPSAPVSALRPR